MGLRHQERRRRVLARDGHRCIYCGGNADTIEHLMPRSKGGTDALANLAAACRSCNRLRGNQSLVRFLRKITSVLREPDMELVR